MQSVRRAAVAAIFTCVLSAQQPPVPGAIVRPLMRAVSLPMVPIPPDPNEPVSGVAQDLTAQTDRSNALALFNRARQVHQLHLPGTPPYQIVATFTSTAGSGNLTETWMNGQKWHWSGNVGGVTAVRVGGEGLHFGSPDGGAIPPAVHVMRNAIFWAADGVPAGGTIRSAAIIWNGKPATCLLFSMSAGAPPTGARGWEEEEYCIDDATGLLQVHSIVPGTFVDYRYGGELFHGRNLPSQITIYSGGTKVLDAQITTKDAGNPDESLFVPTEQMRGYGPVGTGQLPAKMTWQYPAAGVAGVAKPVVVHASVDGQGNVVAEELSSVSDPALAQTALDLVKNRSFPPNGNTRQIYVEIRFVPETQ